MSCCDTGIFDIAILDNILTFPMGLGLQILSGRKIPFQIKDQIAVLIIMPLQIFTYCKNGEVVCGA